MPLSTFSLIFALPFTFADPLSDLLDAVETTLELANIIPDAILDGVEYNLGKEARDIAELANLTMGPGKFLKLGKKAKRVDLHSKKTSIKRHFNVGIASLSKRKGYRILAEKVEVIFDNIQFTCDLITRSTSFTCIDIIRTPSEISHKHTDIGFGTKKAKNANLTGDNAKGNAVAIGTSGTAVQLRTEVWICEDKGGCKEWALVVRPRKPS